MIQIAGLLQHQTCRKCLNGGLRSRWRAVRRVPGLAVAGRVVRSVLDEQFIVDPSLLMVVDFLGTDLTKEGEQEKWLADKAKYLSDLL